MSAILLRTPTFVIRKVRSIFAMETRESKDYLNVNMFSGMSPVWFQI